MASATHTLQAGINQLHQKVRVDGATQSPERLRILAEYCQHELAVRGLENAQIDPEIPGYARAKRWDVVWTHRGKVRLGISLKSLLRNLSGTVPNRGDDLMGEAANLQMYSPETVIGYLMIFNIEEDRHSPKHASTFSNLMRTRLQNITGRRAPHWTIGTVEAVAFVEVNFATGPLLVSGHDEVITMFDVLADQVYFRNPDLIRPPTLPTTTPPIQMPTGEPEDSGDAEASG